jgi:hypothetical protein
MRSGSERMHTWRRTPSTEVIFKHWKCGLLSLKRQVVMVQFLSIIFFYWISSIFVGFFKSSRFFLCHPVISRYWSQLPRSLRRGSTAANLLGLRVRILSEARMDVSCECCVSPGRGHCGADHLSKGVLPSAVFLPECDSQASIMRTPCPTRGCCAMENNRR